MTEQVAEASARRAKIAGVFYLLTFVTGGAALFVRGSGGVALGVVAGGCYVGVTLLFYYIFKPVNRGLSLLAAVVSLVGCAIGPISSVFHPALQISPLVFFGFYCLLIGYLIFRSNFVPRVLGALMTFAGLGWLTFVSPALARDLSPYNLAPGILGEGALTVWLLAFNVSNQRRNEPASAPDESKSQRAVQGNVG